MAPGDATWRVGTVLSQNGGTQAVTGLDGTPKALFFFGTNWTTEDSSVTSSGTGIFRGMCAPLYSSPGTLIQDSETLIPAGDAWAQQPSVAIAMLDTSGGIAFQYAASVASLDADGFTLSWLSGSTPGHKIVYAALMDVTDCLGYQGASATVALGFKAGACLLQGAWAWNAGGNAGSDRTQVWFGGGAYPGSGGGSSWYGAGLSANTFPTSASAQYDIGIFDQAPGVLIAHDATFIGPFLSAQDVTAFPSGGGLTNFTFNTNLADNAGTFVAWSDEASKTGRLTPATSTGGTATVSGLPFPPGLVIGYSISDEPQGQGTGGRGAIGFSVITPDFQWTALIDGVSSRGAFQSFQRGVVDVVNGSNVHAATVTLTSDGFIVETEEDDVSPASWVWHAFGHPRKFTKWIPHIYRRVIEGGSGGFAPVPPPPSFLLLEDGDRLELEDGSGFLILE